MAAFQVFTYGRFWVFTEEGVTPVEIKWYHYPLRFCGLFARRTLALRTLLVILGS